MLNRKPLALCMIAVLSCLLYAGCNEDSNNPTTTMRTTPFEGAQDRCTNGGVKIEVLVDGAVDNAQTQYLCNGKQGQDGKDESGTNITLHAKILTIVKTAYLPTSA